ncbi:MAG: type II toxin-antitoxin system Phd/YefM family antitoxin [Candidatus Riflebacteria bacterium]|nr:type II toxin-antitoxin system Phd/YefM family antitoxin [Candidatus Riflebacteria bacterium]
MPQIIPIKDLKNTSNISEICHTTDEPVYITKNGYGDMVIMSMEVFENLNKKLEMYKSLAISEKQIKDGEILDAKKSIKNLKEKYDL